MQSINRFLYGPTPEERVRAWQAKLRQETRLLDREMRQVVFACRSDVTGLMLSLLASLSPTSLYMCISPHFVLF